MRKVLFIIGFLFVTLPVQAKDIYIAQGATGAGNGSSCSAAYAYTFFNSGNNWGSGAAQIGPGTTVHLCGTISSSLTFQGSGGAGNPITLLAEPGANLTSVNFSANAINGNGQSYLVMDGGSNGVIQNTGTGSTLASQASAGGIVMNPCGHDVEIKNWT